MDVGSDPYPRNPTLAAISERRRREILSTLLDSDSPLTEYGLARRLATTGPGSIGAGGVTPAVRRLRIALVHNHLPALEDAGLIGWNEGDETVERGTHPALDDPRFRRLLGTETEDLDTVLRGLSHEHRRIVLAVLKEAWAPVTSTVLAEEIRRRDAELTGRVPPLVDDILASLHHAYLPELARMNLIEHDSDTERATYAGHSTLDRVFGIICEPNERVADRLDQFLGELHDSYRQVTTGASEPFEWPHFWRVPHRG